MSVCLSLSPSHSYPESKCPSYCTGIPLCNLGEPGFHLPQTSIHSLSCPKSFHSIPLKLSFAITHVCCMKPESSLKQDL